MIVFAASISLSGETAPGALKSDRGKLCLNPTMVQLPLNTVNTSTERMGVLFKNPTNDLMHKSQAKNIRNMNSQGKVTPSKNH